MLDIFVRIQPLQFVLTAMYYFCYQLMLRNGKRSSCSLWNCSCPLILIGKQIYKDNSENQSSSQSEYPIETNLFIFINQLAHYGAQFGTSHTSCAHGLCADKVLVLLAIELTLLLTTCSLFCNSLACFSVFNRSGKV